MPTTASTVDLPVLLGPGLVVQVDPDGAARRLDHVAGEPPSTLTGPLDARGDCPPDFDDQVAGLLPDGWSPVRGFTRQYGSGRADFVMHPSEFVGVPMANAALAAPGLYVVVTVEAIKDDGQSDPEPIGWLLARADLPAGTVVDAGSADLDPSRAGDDPDEMSHEFLVEAREDGAYVLGISLTDVGEVSWTDHDSWDDALAHLGRAFPVVVHAEKP